MLTNIHLRKTAYCEGSGQFRTWCGTVVDYSLSSWSAHHTTCLACNDALDAAASHKAGFLRIEAPAGDAADD